MKNYFLNKAEEREKKVWDFQTALGDTIQAKYASKYVKIMEINDLVPDGEIPIDYFFPDMKVS